MNVVNTNNDHLHALRIAREDLCFAIDIIVDDYHEDFDSPCLWRLLGSIDFIPEILGDSKKFGKIVDSWESNHGSRLRKAIRNYPNFCSII